MKFKGSCLDKEEKVKLEDLLNRNVDVFKHSFEPAKEVEHRIDTEDHEPIAAPPHRLSTQQKELLRREIAQMLTADIIEPCTSEWASPIILAPESQLPLKIHVDYRRLNAITKPDAYSSQKTEDLLNEARSKPYMSTLDLRAGLGLIKIHDEDREKCAFITPIGVFKFKCLTFGLRNAWATFQRLVDKIRNYARDITIIPRKSDIVICSTTFDQHLIDLEKVFTALRTLNVFPIQENSQFCLKKINYFGQYLTSEGVQDNPKKWAAITHLPPPSKLGHLHFFLQIFKYIRSIDNFKEIAEPLLRLTREDEAWEWTEAQGEAFGKLKECLASKPVLVKADDTKPYVVTTVVSTYAIGAVLTQGALENAHPIAYATRFLTPTERGDSTTEQEALAAVWALSIFAEYIEGKPVTLVTDYKPLKRLMDLESSTGKLIRLALQLQAYEITIVHGVGLTLIMADTLAHPTCDKVTKRFCGVCRPPNGYSKTPRSAKEVRKSQLKDNRLDKIIEALEDTENRDAVHWSSKGYLMEKGVLYKYNPDSNKEDFQLVVPQHEWTHVLASFHCGFAHSAEKLYRQISAEHYWSGMQEYIEGCVGQCFQCQQNEANQKPAIKTNCRRFETVAFDLLGPLAKSKKGNQWVIIIEDTATEYKELFALENDSAETCANVLMNEIFLRYGIPKRLISGSQPQFAGAVMQKLVYCLGIDHSLNKGYIPQTSTSMGVTRDLKSLMANLFNDHLDWEEKLPSIRFGINTTAKITGQSPASLTFGRYVRTTESDLHQTVVAERLVPGITMELMLVSDTLMRVNEAIEGKNKEDDDEE